MAKGTTAMEADAGRGRGGSRLHAAPTEYVSFSPSLHFEPQVMSEHGHRDSRSATMRRRLVVASGLLMTAALVLLVGTSGGWGQSDQRRVDMVAWSNEYDDGRGVLHGYQHGVTRVISNICDPDDPGCTFHDSPIGYMAAVWTGKTKESNEKHPRYVQVRKDGLQPSSYEDQIGEGVDSSIAHSGEDGQFHSRTHLGPQYHLVRLPEQEPRTYKHEFYNLGSVQDVDYEEEPEVRAESQERMEGQRSGFPRLKNADDRWRDQPLAGAPYRARAAPSYPEHEEEHGAFVHSAYGSAPKECCAAPPEEEEERVDLMQQLRQASKAVAQEGERYSQVAGRLAAVRSEGASLSREAEAARAMLLKWSGQEKKIAEKMGEVEGEEGCECAKCACGDPVAEEQGEEEAAAEEGEQPAEEEVKEEGQREEEVKEEGGEAAQGEEAGEEKGEPVAEETEEGARPEEGGAVEEGGGSAAEGEEAATPAEEGEVEEPVEEGGEETAPVQEGGEGGRKGGEEEAQAVEAEEPVKEAPAEGGEEEAPAEGGDAVVPGEGGEEEGGEEGVTAVEGGEEEEPAKGGEEAAAPAEGGEERVAAEKEAAAAEEGGGGEEAAAAEGAPDGSTQEAAAKGEGADAPPDAPAPAPAA